MKKYYDAVQKFHDKHEMKGTNNEDMTFRLNLMTEELGELAKAVTKGKPKEEVIEENFDLLHLVIGNFISMRVPFEEVDRIFWQKHERLMNREKRSIGNGNFRVSEFKS